MAAPAPIAATPDPAPVGIVAPPESRESVAADPPADRASDEADEDLVAAPAPSRRRRPPLPVVVGAALAAVLAVVVVARPAPPALHEAAALHPAQAGVLDAARTGIVAADLPGLGDERWSDHASQRDDWVWPQLAGDVVVVHRDAESLVLDRETGERLWAHAGGVTVVGDHLLETDGARVRGLSAADGSERWVLDDVGYPFWTTIEGSLVLLDQDVETRITGVDPDTGAVGWSLDIASEVEGHVEPVDALDGTILLSLQSWEPDDGRRQYRLLTAHPTSGIVREVPLDGDVFAGVQWLHGVLVSGGRALVVAFGDGPESTAVHLVDLASGEVRSPDVMSTGTEYVSAMGDWVSIGGPERSLLLTRDLEPTGIEVEGHLYLDQQTSDRASATYQVHHEDGRTTVHALADGSVVHEQEPFNGDHRRTEHLTGNGVLSSSPDFVRWTPYGQDEPLWTTYLRGDLVHEVAVLGEDVIDIEAHRIRLRGDTGQIIKRWEIAESPGDAPAWHARERVAVTGRFLAMATDTGVRMVGDNGIEVWSADMPSARSVAASKDVVWVASDAEVVALDAVTGEAGRRAAIEAPWAISVAGEQLLVVTSGSGCSDRDPRDCGFRYDALTPDTLEARWSTERVEGACGAPTLAGRHVAVPVVGGAVFLDPASGREVDRWAFEDDRCAHVGFANDEFVVVVGGTLHHGLVGDEPAAVGLRGPAVAEPLVLPGGGLVVPLEEGLLGLGPTWGVAWYQGVPVGLSGRPAITAAGDVVVPRRDGGTLVLEAD